MQDLGRIKKRGDTGRAYLNLSNKKLSKNKMEVFPSHALMNTTLVMKSRPDLICGAKLYFLHVFIQVDLVNVPYRKFIDVACNVTNFPLGSWMFYTLLVVSLGFIVLAVLFY